MSAKTNRGHKAARHLRRMSRKGAHAVKKTFNHFNKTIVTLGDLVSAAYDVGGSTDSVALLLSPLSPLYHLLGRRIVLAA